MRRENPKRPMRVGFVSTRIAGSDGVSLEIEKWATVLGQMDHACYYIAGQSDRPDENFIVFSEAHFTHPVIREVTDQCFGGVIRLTSPVVNQRFGSRSRRWLCFMA